MVSSVQLLLWETRRHAEMSRPNQGIQRTFPRKKVKGMAKPRAKPRPLVAPTVNVIVATSVTGMLMMTGPGETGPDPDGFFWITGGVAGEATFVYRNFPCACAGMFSGQRGGDETANLIISSVAWLFNRCATFLQRQ